MHEDSWLSLVLGKDNWATVEPARVFYTPCNWQEAMKITRRHLRARAQLKSEYIHLLETSLDKSSLLLPISWPNRFKKLMALPDFSSRAELCTKFLVRTILEFVANYQLANEKLDNPLEGWEVAPSSKQPIGL
jgi:hypothetical protein